jgi:chromosome segregation ATPase
VDGTMNNYHPDKARALKHRNNPEILNGSRCEVYYPETKELPVAYHLYDEDVQVFPEDMKMFRLQRSFREMIIRRCTVEQDIEALEKGREEAKEEEKKLLDLVERMTKEPKEVAFAVAQYFNQMKKAESEIHSGVKDISKFKKEKVRSGKERSDKLKKERKPVVQLLHHF